MDAGLELKKVRSTTAQFASACNACNARNPITIYKIMGGAEFVLAALYPESMNEKPEYFADVVKRWVVTNPLVVEQSHFPKMGQAKSIGLYLKSFIYHGTQRFHLSFFGDIQGQESPIDWDSVHMTTDGTKGRRLFYSVNWTQYGPKVTYKPSVTLSGDSNSGKGTSESDSDLAKDKTLVKDCEHLISGLLWFMMDKKGFDKNYYPS